MTSPGKARLALAAVCFFWGTTYFAIRLVVADLPPILFCAVRFLLAGLPMLAYALWRGEVPPRGRDWLDLTVAGLLLLIPGYGVLSWAEQWVPSGIASILVVVTPLWMALFSSLAGERLRGRVLAGLAMGFAGILIVLWPDVGAVRPDRDFIRGCLGILFGTVTWSIGSVYSKRRPAKTGPAMTVAMQLLIGCSVFAVAALINGDAVRWHPTPANWLEILYLSIFGSIVGYGSYVYALGRLPTAQVSIYAYVNPIVAVALGAAFLGERLDANLLLGVPIVLWGIRLVNSPVAAPEAPGAPLPPWTGRLRDRLKEKVPSVLAAAALAAGGLLYLPQLPASVAALDAPEGRALRLGPQAAAGAALLDGRPHPSLRWYMPLGTAAAGTLARNRWALKTAFLFLWLAPALGAWLLAETLAAGSGVLAAGIALAALSAGRYEDLETSAYGLLAALAAWLLARLAEDPSDEAAALSAAGTGASLLVRSPLLLLPAASALLGGRRALACFAYLPLAPWMLLNARLSGRLWPFEAGRADENIVAGALGIVRTSSGHAAPGSPSGVALLSWAAGECLSHPLRTARAVLLRIGWVLFCHPWLWAAALLGLWSLRSRRGARALAVFCGYFLLAHCLMPVEDRYFYPLLPVLSAAAAAGLHSLLAGRGAVEHAQNREAALAAATILSAAIIWADVCVLRYCLR